MSRISPKGNLINEILYDTCEIYKIDIQIFLSIALRSYDIYALLGVGSRTPTHSGFF